MGSIALTMRYDISLKVCIAFIHADFTLRWGFFRITGHGEFQY